MYDSELRRRYTLDRAGIMFVTNRIRDTITSLTPHRNAIAPEMDVITTLTYVTYDSMVNKNKQYMCIYIYTHIVCEREYRKTGIITHVISK